MRNKIFSFINILGLSIGLAASILIFQYVFYELNYDKHIKDADRIYRLKQSVYNKGELSTIWAAGCGSIGIAVKNAFPEVEDFVRMRKANDLLVTYHEKAFKESSLFYSTESFFKIFSYNILKGGKDHLLVEPYNVVITKRIADKYFADEDPIGKTLRINNDPREFLIQAVCETPPDNTHLKFDFLVSWSTWGIINNLVINEDNTWNWYGFLNYVKLNPGIEIEQLENKISVLAEEKNAPSTQNNSSSIFQLQPIKEIHLYSDFMSEVEKNGNGKTTYFLFSIAIFLLLIAWINYINLSTARSVDRAKEVGLKKVVGANTISLIRQFIFESVVMNLIAIFIAILLIIIFIPQFAFSTSTKVDVRSLFDSQIWYIIMAVFLTGSILVGLYPAIVLSSFQPIKVLKGHFKNSSKGILFRKSSVISQFIISFVLIAGTIIIFRQISFMRKQNKNFSYENVLVLKGPIVADTSYSNRYNTFKTEVLQKASVEGFSASVCIPGRKPTWNAAGIRLEGADVTRGTEYRIVVVDHDFLDVYQLQLAAGRFFNKEFSTDLTSILLNESGMRQLGFNEPDSVINKRIWYGGSIYNIIGIIKDYNQESLKSNFDPYLFRLIPNVRSYYSILIDKKGNSQLIKEIEALWNNYFPNLPFEYFFAEDYYNEQYKPEDQFSAIFFLFSVLAIIIACLGLFGLASYSASQRTKEIGIRKVLGASSVQIIKAFSYDYLKLMGISILVGLPVCYFILNKWLLGFANHININLWLLLIPSLIVIIIAMLTISSNAFKLSNKNPVDSLKYE